MAEDVLKSPMLWFVVLAVAAVLSPYALRVPPSTRRQRLYIAITLAWLGWLLPLMVSLRSR